MAKQIDDLAAVLRSLRMSSRSTSLPDEVEALRLIVQQMATTLALHEVQLAKLTETVAAVAVRDGQ